MSAPAAPAAPAATSLPIMKGGAREQMIDIAKKYATPLNNYIGLALILLIVYVGKIPDNIPYRANTLLGRAVLFFGTLFIATLYSWIYAVLMALFVVLLLSVAPRTLKEGFQAVMAAAKDTAAGTDSEVKLVSQKKKWWVEEVFEENPIGIEEEKVRTSAIQDNSNSSSSTGGAP